MFVHLSYGGRSQWGGVNIVKDAVYRFSKFLTQDFLYIHKRNWRCLIKAFLKFLNIFCGEQRGCRCNKLVQKKEKRIMIRDCHGINYIEQMATELKR